MMTRKKLLVLLVSCSVMATCRAGSDFGEPRITDLPDGDSGPNASPSLRTEGALIDTARQAQTSTGRVDAALARLGVSRVQTTTNDPLLRLDTALLGPCDLPTALLRRDGFSIDDQNEYLLVSADRTRPMRDLLRRAVPSLDDGIDLLRMNLAAQGRVGHKARVCSLNPDGAQPPSAVADAPLRLDMSQGALAVTGHSLDLAIWGKGFFVLDCTDGNRQRRVYTRDGRFLVQPNGTIVSRWVDGAKLAPETFVPIESTNLAISPDGRMHHKKATDFVAREVGRLVIAWFDHPEHLEPIGDSLFAQTPECGAIIQGHPTEDSLGRIIQGRLELSNVNVSQTWTDLCRLEDTRQIMLAMIASLDPPGWLAAGTKTPGDAATSCPVVSLPLTDPPPQRMEPTLLRFLRLRGVDALAADGTIHLRNEALTAAGMSAYLKFLRLGLNALADNIAGAQASGATGAPSRLYRRRFVDLTESGEVKLVEDLSPPHVAAADATDELIAGSNVEIAWEMAMVDHLSAEYRDVRD